MKKLNNTFSNRVVFGRREAPPAEFVAEAEAEYARISKYDIKGKPQDK